MTVADQLTTRLTVGDQDQYSSRRGSAELATCVVFNSAILLLSLCLKILAFTVTSLCVILSEFPQFHETSFP